MTKWNKSHIGRTYTRCMCENSGENRGFGESGMLQRQEGQARPKVGRANGLLGSTGTGDESAEGAGKEPTQVRAGEGTRGTEAWLEG